MEKQVINKILKYDVAKIPKVFQIIPRHKNTAMGQFSKSPSIKFMTGNSFTFTVLTQDNLDDPGKYLNMLCVFRY